MCPMASLFNLIGTHASLTRTLQWFLKGGRIFPPKTTFGSHIGFCL